MSPRKPAFRRRTRTTVDMHRSWLALVDCDGPFLSVPALKEVYPQGIPTMADVVEGELKQQKATFEKVWERWDADHEGQRAALRTARDEWVDFMVRRGLGWGEWYDADAEPVSVRSPNHAVTSHSTGVLRRNDATAALLWVVDPVRNLRDNLSDGWATSPIDRMELMLRESGIRIGVVTDGRWWAMVSAAPDTMVASGIVDSQTWIEESATRDAFIELLGLRRLLAGQEDQRLPQLFAKSVAAAEEITEALGSQVRRAIELLVQAFSEAGLDARQQGRPSPLPADGHEVYEAAVTVMMRVVFLLFAEERDLLPAGDLFTNAYGLSGQREALHARAEIEGEEALDATSGLWHRLLSTSAALYGGATFEDLRIPAYGGSLFDPTRFAFLTDLGDHGDLALTVSDRVMMHALDAVQLAKTKGDPVARQISFRDIDVEQIGYIYEGLLGYTCDYAPETIIGLIGSATGSEPEIPMSVLRRLADENGDDKSLAEAIVDWLKAEQPASKPPTVGTLAKRLAASDTVPDADRALRAVTRDADLRSELATWIGAIRRDLRGIPTVFPAGGLVVIETPSRKNAGAHYTPRSLAEEVVLHALEPLVYSPGPHQTDDRDSWRLTSSDAILDLRVADIACGSGAFLVAAARYLGSKVVEAWEVEGIEGDPATLKIDAIREVVARCLYGADINPMAIEMCKLSLWLVSLDRRLPFSFVDDKLLVGNSLLGITSVDQLRALNIRPEDATAQTALFSTQGADVTASLDLNGVMADALRLRRALATEVNNTDPTRSARTKSRQLDELHARTAQLTTLADGVIAAGLALGGKPGKALREVYENLRDAAIQAYATDAVPSSDHLHAIIERGLTPTVTTDYARWQCIHWPLVLPDITERGGFDAVIGNPPFLGGQKLTGAMGTNVRDWFVHVLAGGTKGSADLVAYFFLRGFALLNQRGTVGLIATNTVAQGDTRQVGLDRMAAEGFTITRAVQSASWPSASANLEYAAVWGSRAQVADGVTRRANGEPAVAVSTLLEAEGRVTGDPMRLAENQGTAFIGCYVLGMGFVITPAEAQQWIDDDPRNAEVLFPYLTGEDLNQRPDVSAPRWVIDFNDRTEQRAAEYSAPFNRLEELVKSDRATNNRKVYRDRWWQFAERRSALRTAIAELDEVLAIARVSKTVMPMRIPTGQVISEQLVVFATDAYAQQAMLSAAPHQMWAITYGSTLETRVRYTPSDVFETLPRPAETVWLDHIGRTLDQERREMMLRRDLGLTKLYNLVNDPDVRGDADVDRLRLIHVELDEAVMDAYGWGDVPLDHGFHTYRQMRRWTVSPAARVEILDRLLEENHRRAALQTSDVLDAVPDDEGAER